LRANFPNLNDAALRAIKAKFTPMNGASLAGLFSEGQQLGISAEDLARIIVRTDCNEASVQAYLDQYFPDLSAAAKAAVTKAIAGEGGSVGSKLVNELKGLGISDADIAKIITAQATGDTSAIADILTSRYSGVKQQAYDALSQAWNSGQGHFDTSSAGLSFGAQLIIDMFTNGKADDKRAVDAALNEAKEKIAQKRRELIAVINGGGEKAGEAQQALTLLDQYDKALTDYATNYANASTAVCEEQGQTLLAMCQQAEDATNKILAQEQRLVSHQEKAYNLGVGGAQLNQGDYELALGYIKHTYEEEKKALDEAYEQARDLVSPEQYAELDAQYQEAIDAINKHKESMVQALISGQSGGGSADRAVIDLAGFLKSLGFEGQEKISPELVQNYLKSRGYSAETIEQALASLFPKGTDEDLLADTIGDYVHVGDEATREALEQAFADGNLTEAKVREIFQEHDYSSETIEGAIAELFPDSLDYSALISNLDLSGLGSVVKTAVDSGLVEGMDDANTDQIDAYILNCASAIDTEAAGQEVKDKTKAIGGFASEGMAEGMSDTSAVEKPGKALGKAAVDYVAVGAECQSPSAATKRTGEYVAQGLKEGMGDTSSVQAAGKTLGAAAVNAVKGSATGTDAAGRALAAGVARGIAAGRSQVINAAIQLAQATVQAMKEALQIHSPSRVGVGLGANFGEAFSSGLEDSLNTALRSAQTVVGLNNLSPKMDFGGLAGSFGRALQGFADAESDRPVDVYLNGRKVGGTMDRDNARAAAAYNRRVALGYGK
jgi:SOS response regulatory protein OraA/RecX